MKTKVIIGLIGILLLTSVAFIALPAVLAKPSIDMPHNPPGSGGAHSKKTGVKGHLFLYEKATSIELLLMMVL